MWRRREDAENPAWPGLVDIFAFTLAFLLIIWFVNNLPQKVDNLEKETQNLSTKISSLAGEKQQLQNLNQSLRDKVARLDQNNQNLSSQVLLLEEGMRNLDSQKKVLQEANVDLNAAVQHLNKENASLKDIGRQDWEELLQMLQSKLAGMQWAIIPNEQDKEIEIHGKPKITFETLKYELSAEEKQRLELLAPILSDLLRQKQFFITINGTADPRELNNADPPRNNTELSALRAATVAALLENASSGLGRHLRVMGLGIKGQKRTLSPGDDPDRFYKEYRNVSLVLKIDVATLMRNDQAKQPN